MSLTSLLPWSNSFAWTGRGDHLKTFLLLALLLSSLLNIVGEWVWVVAHVILVSSPVASGLLDLGLL